ncbi:MAG: response regulator [Bacteroidota bacterium]
MAKLSCIFLVDDDYPTNYFHQLIIEETNCTSEVVVCQSGHEALERLAHRESQQLAPPDLIFLDINMPGMTGWEFMEQYQRLPKATRGTVLVLLTTSLNPDEESRAKEWEGIDDFRHKPLSGEMLTDLIDQHF